MAGIFWVAVGICFGGRCGGKFFFGWLVLWDVFVGWLVSIMVWL